jgi:peptidylprolyl isomerase
MKTTFPLSVLAFTIAASPLAAQSAKPAAPPAAQKTASNTPATAAAKKQASTQACAKLPELSPKVPALPADLPCAKPLYTITLSPTAKLSDVSPMEDPNLRDALGIQLPSSFTLSYIDTKVGSGARVAPRKWYTIQYTGYLVDGTKFDSSYDHPDHAPLSFLQGPGPQGQRQVVPGMDTGLDGMRVGGKRRIFIPYQLAYGPNQYKNIPPKSWLIFDVDLVSQSDNDPRPNPPVPPAATAPKPPTPAAPTTPPSPAAAPKPATAPTPAASPAPAATAPKPPTPPAPAAAPAPAAPKP